MKTRGTRHAEWKHAPSASHSPCVVRPGWNPNPLHPWIKCSLWTARGAYRRRTTQACTPTMTRMETRLVSYIPSLPCLVGKGYHDAFRGFRSRVSITDLSTWLTIRNLLLIMFVPWTNRSGIQCPSAFFFWLLVRIAMNLNYICSCMYFILLGNLY
jgi:hypothetical protein